MRRRGGDARRCADPPRLKAARALRIFTRSKLASSFMGSSSQAWPRAGQIGAQFGRGQDPACGRATAIGQSPAPARAQRAHAGKPVQPAAARQAQQESLGLIVQVVADKKVAILFFFSQAPIRR